MNIEFENALSKAKKFCSYKEVCEQDILKKFLDWNIPKNIHSQILEKLFDENFINNQRFANCFAHDKLKFNNWGKIKIKYELQLKKIPNEAIYNALDAIDRELYIQIAKKLIISKIKTISLSDDKKTKQKKVLAYMYSKGFEVDIVKEVLNKIDL